MSDGRQHSFLNTVYLYTYKYDRKRGITPFFARQTAVMRASAPFMLFLLVGLFALEREWGISAPLQYTFESGRLVLLVLVALPLWISFGAVTYSREKSEATELSDDDYARGRKYFYILLAIALGLVFASPFLFGTA